MTDTLSRAAERLSEISAAIASLEVERNEIETALVVLSRYGRAEPAEQSNPVANTGEVADGAIAAVADDPASREDGAADRQQPTASGFTGEGEAVSADLPADQPQTATEQRENVLSQHEGGPGSTSPAPEPQCDTMGVTAGETAPSTDPDAAPGESADAKISPSKPLTVVWRIRSLLVDNPDLTVPEASEKLGIRQEQVRGACAKAGLKLRKLTTAERGERIKQGMGQDETPEPPADEPAQSVVEDPPREPSLRIATKAKFFRLRDKTTGKYLHQSVSRGIDKKPLMTNLRGYPWQGTEAQLVAVRRKLPETVDMMTEPVES